ncbi:hypothetical protein [Hoeflea marina]|uniref:COG3904 family protein n=1 Tax=Hoeflea marina TaxID=274592 RepID=UPI001FE06091|nr:hypothetical protein [Hoeflea marina]
MRLFLAFLGTFVGLTAWISSTEAAVSIHQISVDGGANIIVIKGEFEFDDDSAVLAREVAASNAQIVTFDSNGGNIYAAMAFGRAIRSLGLKTVQIRSAECASACALAFVGGAMRTAEPGSIGVHRSSFSAASDIDGHSAVAAVQAATADIMLYLIEMGIDPTLLQLSLSVDSSDMRYLTASEMAVFRVTSSSPSEETVEVRADKSVPVVIEPPIKADALSAVSVQDRALQFVARYHEAWSWPNRRAIDFMENAYADTVVFYGKAISMDKVIQEKVTFAERWPERAYSVKHGTERANCASMCTVSATVEWYAHSSKRARYSSGAAEFALTWNPVTGKIESENGKVIQTDKKVHAPIRIFSQWQEQNGQCRGGPGDSEDTMKACERREAIGAKLEAIGWCYGRPGEYGYQIDWHVCGQ